MLISGQKCANGIVDRINNVDHVELVDHGWRHLSLATTGIPNNPICIIFYPFVRLH